MKILAEKSGVSSRYIKEIENHGNVPSLEKPGQLIRALHISANPLFFQPPRQTISTTSDCWFICHNVQRNRLQQSSLLWKPIFGHTNLPKNRISPISEFSHEYFWIILNHAKRWLAFHLASHPFVYLLIFFRSSLIRIRFFMNARWGWCGRRTACPRPRGSQALSYGRGSDFSAQFRWRRPAGRTRPRL